MRMFLAALVALSIATPAAAQQRPANAAASHADHAAHGGGSFPAGWSARVDGNQPASKVVFKTMANGLHATTGPAAVFYHAQWTKSGSYKIGARLTQTKAPAHPEGYGLVIGGRDLAGAGQAYTYFLVRGTGEYFIATRKGADRTVLVDWTAHRSILKQDPSTGQASNLLGVEVRGDEVVFTVNGVEVARRPKSGIPTDGHAGFRVNHNLDVHIDQVTR